MVRSNGFGAVWRVARYSRCGDRLEFRYCNTFALTLLAESMIVCVCNAIREKELREAASCHRERPTDVYARLGRKPKCGQCLSFARDVISMKATTA